MCYTCALHYCVHKGRPPHHACSDTGCTQITEHVALGELSGMHGQHHLHSFGSLIANRPHNDSASSVRRIRGNILQKMIDSAKSLSGWLVLLRNYLLRGGEVGAACKEASSCVAA